jgi:putative spermidine/putrescine transport system permease protein
MRRITISQLIVLLFVAGVLAFQLAPLVPVVVSSFSGSSLVRFPPEGFSFHWYPDIPASYWWALSVSLLVAGLTAIFTCLLGVPATFALIRGSYPGRNFMRALLTSPLQVPQVVSGLVFMQFFFWLARAMQVQLLGSVIGLTIAHVILGLPFVISTVGPVLQRFPVGLEEAALSLGANRWRTIRKVTLPVISSAIFSGAMYAFIASFGNVAATLFLVTTKTVTLPVEIFYAMEFDMRPNILAMSTLVIVLSAIIVHLSYRFAGAEGRGEKQRL